MISEIIIFFCHWHYHYDLDIINHDIIIIGEYYYYYFLLLTVDGLFSGQDERVGRR